MVKWNSHKSLPSHSMDLTILNNNLQKYFTAVEPQFLLRIVSRGNYLVMNGQGHFALYVSKLQVLAVPEKSSHKVIV